ncbi:MAG: hypothetical protein JGK31_30025 [Microcoleus sp. PH2017_30_WIL_O_A]|nr:hypothetical protein [Microcoleus sp. PH2017_30_WIL_O_A]
MSNIDYFWVALSMFLRAVLPSLRSPHQRILSLKPGFCLQDTLSLSRLFGRSPQPEC